MLSTLFFDMPESRSSRIVRAAASILLICLSLALAVAAVSHSHSGPSHHTCTVCQLSQTIDTPPDARPAVSELTAKEWHKLVAGAVAMLEPLRDSDPTRAPPADPPVNA